MSDDTQVPSKEELVQLLEDRRFALEDPEGYVQAKQVAAIETEAENLIDMARAAEASDLIEEIERQRDLRLAQLLPEPTSPPAPASQKTVAALGFPAGTITVAKWSATQFVEPLRDGAPWCTWADAEEMLVNAAQAAMRGAAGLRATRYSLLRDNAASTLRLTLE